VPGGFIRHPVRGEAPQFLIDKRQQLLSGGGIACLGGMQNGCDLAHAPNYHRNESRQPGNF
jgi:hypothetical protein